MTSGGNFTCDICNRQFPATELGGNVEGTESVFCQECIPKAVNIAVIFAASQDRRDLSMDELRKINVLHRGKGIEAINNLKLREANPQANEVHLSYFRMGSPGELEFGFRCLQCSREVSLRSQNTFSGKSQGERLMWVADFYCRFRDDLVLPCTHCGHQHVLVK